MVVILLFFLVVFFHVFVINLLQSVLSSTYCDMVFHRFVVTDNCVVNG